MTRFAPLVAAFALVAVLGFGLAVADRRREAPSPLVGQPIPEFVLDGPRGFSSRDFRDRPALLHLFASWCRPCIAEAPLLAELASEGVIIRAIAVRDQPADTQRFLDRHGDPFQALGHDPQGQLMLALGATGVPETLVVDSDGVVRHHHRGAIDDAERQRLSALLHAWR